MCTSRAKSQLLPLVKKKKEIQPSSAVGTGTLSHRQLTPTCHLPQAADRSCVFIFHGQGLTKQWHSIRGDETRWFCLCYQD